MEDYSTYLKETGQLRLYLMPYGVFEQIRENPYLQYFLGAEIGRMLGLDLTVGFLLLFGFPKGRQLILLRAIPS